MIKNDASPHDLHQDRSRLALVHAYCQLERQRAQSLHEKGICEISEQIKNGHCLPAGGSRISGAA